MTLESLILSGVKWFWEKYGKDIVDKATGELKKTWQEFEWEKAEKKYFLRVKDLYSTTRLLGYSKPVSIEGIYTDVYVLDTLTATRRYTIEQLLSSQNEKKDAFQVEKRIPINNLLQRTRLLYILGKPGAGKTTLLKYITMSACTKKIKKESENTEVSSLSERIALRKTNPDEKKSNILTPIFVSLKEWADSNITLEDFMAKQFEMCEFPDARIFLFQLMKDGGAIILCDGLDEVGDERLQQEFIKAITLLQRTYFECKIIITCRIAAVEYFFDQFTYVEIADFDNDQIKTFIGKWFQSDQQKLKHFVFELAKYENRGLLELARTPLLLALMCLAYEESLVFPRRRVELYKEAIDALLRKWDATRGIKRDDIYHNLPTRRKEQLLSYIAMENFIRNSIFFRKEALVDQISHYLKRLPPADTKLFPLDGEAVMKAIEAQHGLLVERARDIYSFSHLTFQEYFVAKYIVDNSGSGTINTLLEHIDNPQWNEVFLVVASLLDDADAFFSSFVIAYSHLAQNSRDIKRLLLLGDKITPRVTDKKYLALLVGVFIALVICRRGVIVDAKADQTELFRSFTYAIKLVHDLIHRLMPIDDPYFFKLKEVYVEAISDDLDKILNPYKMAEFIRSLGVKLNKDDFAIRINQAGEIIRYLQTTVLLVDCLELSIVSDRENILLQILS